MTSSSEKSSPDRRQLRPTSDTSSFSESPVGKRGRGRGRGREEVEEGADQLELSGVVVEEEEKVQKNNTGGMLQLLHSKRGRGIYYRESLTF